MRGVAPRARVFVRSQHEVGLAITARSNSGRELQAILSNGFLATRLSKLNGELRPQGIVIRHPIRDRTLRQTNSAIDIGQEIHVPGP